MLVFRRKRPSGVTRGSFLILNTGPLISFMDINSSCTSSALGIIVRNLYMLNIRLLRPTRFWRKKIGPADVNLTRIAVAISSGDKTISANVAPTKSITRLISDGHVRTDVDDAAT